MLLWTLFVCSAIYIYVKFLKPTNIFKEKNVPYDEPTMFFGSMYRISCRKVSFADGLVEIYNKHKMHKYFGVYNFNQPMLVVKDPEVLKQIGIKDFDSFLDHQSFVDEELDPLFGKNVFSLKGQKWRKMRSTLSPAFTTSKMKSMFVLISESADRFTDYFLKNAAADKPTSVELKDTFTRFASDVIATCAFGIENDSLTYKENEFYLAGKEATDFSGFRGLIFFGYNICPFLMRLFKIRLFSIKLTNFFRGLVIGTMNMREEKGIVRPDMINLLMQAKKGNLKFEENLKKDEDTGFATVEESDVGKDEKFKFTELTDDDLTAQALIFFFAGFDSISNLLCHMANELAVNPDVHQKLQAEVDETLNNCSGGKITYDAVTKMKYMDMVVCETLRKWPPTPIADRLCTKPYIIKTDDKNDPPVIMNKGDLVWIPTYAMHRDPAFFPDPERFDPERFSDVNKDNIIPFSYIPFGLGPRNCIGSRFVLLETKLIFIYLLSKFNIVVDAKTQIPLKLSRSTFNMVGENGFWVGLKPRQNLK